MTQKPKETCQSHCGGPKGFKTIFSLNLLVENTNTYRKYIQFVNCIWNLAVPIAAAVCSKNSLRIPTAENRLL